MSSNTKNNLLLVSLTFLFEMLQHVQAQLDNNDDDATEKPSKTAMMAIDISLMCIFGLIVTSLTLYCVLRNCSEKEQYKNNRCLQWLFKSKGNGRANEGVGRADDNELSSTPVTPSLSSREDSSLLSSVISDDQQPLLGNPKHLNPTPLRSPVSDDQQPLLGNPQLNYRYSAPQTRESGDKSWMAQSRVPGKK